MVTTRDRFLGCLLGLATGDALGTTLEFERPGTFQPIDDMIGGGPFRLEPGQWTDDTSMALCLATSLVESGGFDALDQMRRYVRWWKEGYLSSNGLCFDIGNTTRDALARFRRTGDPIAGPSHELSAGNASLRCPCILQVTPWKPSKEAPIVPIPHTGLRKRLTPADTLPVYLSVP